MKERFFEINNNLTIRTIAEKIDAKTLASEKDLDQVISDVKNIEDASEGDLTFVDNKRYISKINDTKASVCIVNEKFNISGIDNDNLVILSVDNAYLRYAEIVDLLFTQKTSHSKLFISETAKIGDQTMISPGAVIEDNVIIGDNCYIGPNAVISQGVIIGNNTKIMAGSYISFATIGNDCIVHPGAKVGSDGFGFASHNGIHKKIIHTGIVKIGNDVEIGSNSTIDRGSVKNTIIADSVMIDNLVQIGHNVEIGNGSVIVSQVGIAGSTKIGKYVVIGGQAGINGHIEIADQTQIAARSGVVKTVTDKGAIIGGYPAIPIREWHKQSIILKNLANGKQ